MNSQTITPPTRLSFHGIFTVGSVGKIQETREGKSVMNISICFNDIKTHDGEKIKTAVWIDCEVWERLAHHCASFVNVGDTITAQGNMKPPRSFTHKGQQKINLRGKIDFFSVIKRRHTATESTESDF